jgi:hypothetical protein
MSTFSIVSQIFGNVRESLFNRHEVGNNTIARMMRDSSRLFKILDRSDSVQADLSLRLWILRSSVLFTLLPFDDLSLGLMKKMEEFSQSASGLPEAALFVESIGKAVDDLVASGVNMKREWLLHTMSVDEDADAGVGVLCALSAGKAPGWPTEKSLELVDQFKGLKLIKSRKDLRSGVLKRIILPCACRNAPSALLAEVIHSGRSFMIDVLLYPEEKFNDSKRLTPPVCSIFKGKLQKQIRQHEIHVVRDENAFAAVDDWMNEAFWQGIHGGDRRAAANLVSANYVLFCDGTGAFLPANGRVPTIPENEDLSGVSDLRLVCVENVCEGDLVVLKAGDSSFLLDEASDQIMHNHGGQNLVDEATDWKSALDALLLTHSREAVAKELRERGVSISPLSISQWAGTDLLGPGSERAFKALMGLLGDKGKLGENDQNMTEYAESRWASLQELRRVRHRAGNMIRQELLKKLYSRLCSGIGRIGNRTSINLDGDSGVELLILRVSSVDQNPAFIPPYRLCRLDDLKDNKWLG